CAPSSGGTHDAQADRYSRGSGAVAGGRRTRAHRRPERRPKTRGARRAGAARALTVDEIVARNVEARGGAARLAAVRSLRLTGKIHLSGRGYSVEAVWGQLQK